MASLSWPLSTPSTGGTGGTAQIEQVDIQLDRQFGKDMFFEGDYALTPTGDYTLLSGFDNLRAAIYRRLITRPGEYKFVPEYGIGVQSFVKRKRTTPVIDELKRAIETNLLRDPRIDSIDIIDIKTDDDVITIGIKAKVAGRELRFRPFSFSEKI